MPEDDMFKNAVALLVGINGFRRKTAWKHLPELQHAASDARRMQKALKLVGFPDDRITCLCNKYATFNNIMNAFSKIAEKLPFSQSYSLFVLYFACHCEIVEDVGVQANYLLPYDAYLNGKRVVQGIEPDWFMERLKAVHTKRKVIFLDVCYSGASPGKMYKKLAAPGTALFAACNGIQESVEVDGHGGLFTRRLIHALCGLAGNNKNGYVSLFQIANYIQTKVPKDAISYGIVQEPYIQMSNPGNFHIGKDCTEFVVDRLLESHLNTSVRRRSINAITQQYLPDED